MVTFGHDFHFLAHHERRVEAQAEVSDDGIGIVFIFIQEVIGAGERDLVDVPVSYTHLDVYKRQVVDHIPAWMRKWINSRFNQDEAIIPNGAAFDLVRASVNLVLAGLLIVVGTSLKLPLSTTYVAFMVGMGSSLADRAWGRESRCV